MKQRARTTAFVLSGGGSLGAIQVGMLEALFERGITPDLIVGTSAGALNGAFIATRPQTIQTARELGQVWRSLRRAQIFPANPLTGALGFMGARDHLIPASGLRRLMRKHATSVEWDGRQLIDGGVSNNVPLSHALELDADQIYVLPTGAPCELKEPPRGVLPMLLYATGLLIGHRWRAELGLLDPGVDVVVLPPPCPLPVQPTDFSRADELIERARSDARRCLRSREMASPLLRHPRRATRNSVPASLHSRNE